MLDTSALAIGMTGAALLFGSLAPVPSQGRASQNVIESPAFQTSSTPKAARLSSAQSSPKVSAWAVEVTGSGEGALVVMRDREGQLLYRSDPAAGTILVSKNLDLPFITLSPPPPAPSPEVKRDEEGSQLPLPSAKSVRPVGCETALSPLVKTSSSSAGLCLAFAD